MNELRRKIAAVALTCSTVMLTGETGTGKGLVARSLHKLSPRRNAPFIHAECTFLSSTVSESEFFGHERGAFTGAVNQRAGRFELAREGTIFLDEIGDLEPVFQGKLLRVLEDREYERVGGIKTLPMTARVIAATNKDLHTAVNEGHFRMDLFFRLNVIHYRLPSLREHIDDVPCLLQFTTNRLANRLGVPLPTLTPALESRLMEYDWPGNVRELINVVERLMAESPAGTLETDGLDEILRNSLWKTTGSHPQTLPATQASSQTSKDAASVAARSDAGRPEQIAAQLASAGGNVARTARRMNVPRSTLCYWIQRYQLDHLIPKD